MGGADLPLAAGGEESEADAGQSAEGKECHDAEADPHEASEDFDLEVGGGADVDFGERLAKEDGGHQGEEEEIGEGCWGEDGVPHGYEGG